MWLGVLKLIATALALVEKLIPSRTEKLATKAARVEHYKEVVEKYEKIIRNPRLKFNDAIKRMRDRNRSN